MQVLPKPVKKRESARNLSTDHHPLGSDGEAPFGRSLRSRQLKPRVAPDFTLCHMCASVVPAALQPAVLMLLQCCQNYRCGHVGVGEMLRACANALSSGEVRLADLFPTPFGTNRHS